VTLTAEFVRRNGVVSDAYVYHIVGYFVGPSYLWMWPFEGYLIKKFKAYLADLSSEKPVKLRWAQALLQGTLHPVLPE
jgi:hypothetical protein